MRLLSLILLLASPASLLHAQTAPSKTLNVYPGAVPGSAVPGGAVPGALGHAAADHPTLDVYLPANNPTHTAVLVIPGGSYHNVEADREGAAPAQWLV